MKATSINMPTCLVKIGCQALPKVTILFLIHLSTDQGRGTFNVDWYKVWKAIAFLDVGFTLGV